VVVESFDEEEGGTGGAETTGTGVEVVAASVSFVVELDSKT
jgi:hypothetical protein